MPGSFNQLCMSGLRSDCSVNGGHQETGSNWYHRLPSGVRIIGLTQLIEFLAELFALLFVVHTVMLEST